MVGDELVNGLHQRPTIPFLSNPGSFRSVTRIYISRIEQTAWKTFERNTIYDE